MSCTRRTGIDWTSGIDERQELIGRVTRCSLRTQRRPFVARASAPAFSANYGSEGDKRDRAEGDTNADANQARPKVPHGRSGPGHRTPQACNPDDQSIDDLCRSGQVESGNASGEASHTSLSRPWGVQTSLWSLPWTLAVSAGQLAHFPTSVDGPWRPGYESPQAVRAGSAQRTSRTFATRPPSPPDIRTMPDREVPVSSVTTTSKRRCERDPDRAPQEPVENHERLTVPSPK